MAVVYLAARLTHTDYVRAAWVLRHLYADTKICASGINKLCQHPAERGVDACLVCGSLSKGTERSTAQI